jgi:CBS domain-containing protein
MRNLLAQGVPAEQLTRIIATLNDLLTARVVELEARAAQLEADAFCWLALGSEGRHEQTLATDQDNAIVFPEPAEGPAEAAREHLLPFARSVNRALAACGFPLCKGEIMAGNPRWCLSLPEWQGQFLRWMGEPDAPALLNSTIFFDFRALFGATELAQRLRTWLADAAKPRDLFRRFMAENALRNEPPLGLVRDFAVGDHEGRPDTLDLKVNGAALFVDAARILALGTGDTHTSTVERLRGAGQARKLASGDVEGWIDAFHFIQSLRMTHQQEQIEAGVAPDNYLRPEALNPLDRRILKEALRQARKLQERLRLDYRL